jgi:xanthine dehydrogenase YagT iron-sulfur-binding subunit
MRHKRAKRALRRQSLPAVVGPGKVAVNIHMNGSTYQAQLEPCVTLLDAMREVWGLTGAKRVCDRATCGACTVLLNGRRVYSCSLLAIDVQDDEITTVESLGKGDDQDPVQQAFINNDAMQCGFCTPGFVMSCKGFLSENANPTPEEIFSGMSGNLCRCGSYVGIQLAVARAAKANRRVHRGKMSATRAKR